MASFKINGIVLRTTPQETKGNFTFAELHLRTETDSQYPQVLNIQFSGKNLELLEGVHEGQSVEVEINIRGRESNGKVWNTLSAWKLSIQSKSTPAPAPPIANNIPTHIPSGTTIHTESIDDLPF